MKTLGSGTGQLLDWSIHSPIWVGSDDATKRYSPRIYPQKPQSVLGDSGRGRFFITVNSSRDHVL